MSDRWKLRSVPDELVRRYLAEGWWNDVTLGTTVANGLSTLGDTEFHVHSDVRPWRGTFGDVDRAARSLAGSLRARGVGPGDVVVFQLPNWVEAGITFWAAAYLGAVVVPVVHFYGAKEVGYILRATSPKAIVTPDRFGHSDYLSVYEPLLSDSGRRDSPLWLVVGETARQDLPASATRSSRCSRAIHCGPGDRRSRRPGDRGLHVRDDARSQGSHPFPPHDRVRDPPARLHVPQRWPAQITGAPVGHFIGMLNAFLIPLLRERPVHLIDVWKPDKVLRLMREEGLGVTGGATYFMTSLLDHPDFTDEHLALMPFAGLGGSAVPVAVMERLKALGIKAFRSYGSTEHPSITGCLLDDAEEKRLRTDGDPLPGVELRLEDGGEILSRGPDCFVGYIDPELTAKVFDDEGWYRTGDVGVLDDEGYLSITDRVSDIIIRGGENISAQEVEELLMGMDAVAEVSVVAAPDVRLGERAAAVIRLREGGRAPTLDEVRKHLASVGLARQKWPESLHLVDEFPRTPSGKVQKFVLRQQLREGRLAPYA